MVRVPAGQVPSFIPPMLATAGPLPEDEEGWSYEFKWDGIRGICCVGAGGGRFFSRNGNELTGSFPTLVPAEEFLTSLSLVFDGEIVALDDNGTPSFERLQGRGHSVDSRIVYVVFDVLAIDERPLFDVPYVMRREVLDDFELDNLESWTTSPSFLGPGSDVLDASREAGLEGVIAKRLDSTYTPGKRSRAWIKVKLTRTQEVVIGGFTLGEGSRSAGIGAVLVGLPTEGGLRYLGKVGSGFGSAELADLGMMLNGTVSARSPFVDVPRKDARGATWVEPVVVGEVRFTELTQAGRFRHPVWRGLRVDKTPSEVTEE